jgi:hypothetical protein
MTSLPPLASRWMADLLQATIPEESLATCDNCAMLKEHHRLSPDPVSFRPDTKCCTYLPDLANFLVGGILRDPDPASQEGRETIEARINRGVGVTPLGLKQDRKFLALYSASRGAFGRNLALRCPHLLADGRCGVWHHRESTCATWFCKHQRGATGFAFWTALRGLLKSIEQSLAAWCVLKIGVSPDCLSELFPTGNEPQPREITAPELDQQNFASTQKTFWGNWLGRERDFYLQCAALVEELDWATVREITGPETIARSQIVIDRFTQLSSSKIPERLVGGKWQLVQITPAFAKVRSYSDFDPLRMSRTLYEVLPFFDGRPIEEVQKEMKSAKGATVGLDLLRRLVDHGILVADQSEILDGPVG